VAVILRPAAHALIASPAGGLAMRTCARLLGQRNFLIRAQALRALVRATDSARRGSQP
jgi:hypothetical protein